ncbi:MAG TPA: hypothetical protein VMF89_28305, partial [Polyangiales bacterium]|nr:hypothetical protein [Polyangiales bacterium]
SGRNRMCCCPRKSTCARSAVRLSIKCALPLREDQDAHTPNFYLRRNELTAAQTPPKRFHDEAKPMAASTDLVSAGGDLNTIPPASTQRRDFPDSV